MWAFSVHQLASFSLDLEVRSPTKANSSETVSEFKQGPKLSAINTQLLIDKHQEIPQMAFNRQKLKLLDLFRGDYASKRIMWRIRINNPVS